MSVCLQRQTFYWSFHWSVQVASGPGLRCATFTDSYIYPFTFFYLSLSLSLSISPVASRATAVKFNEPEALKVKQLQMAWADNRRDLKRDGDGEREREHLWNCLLELLQVRKSDDLMSKLHSPNSQMKYYVFLMRHSIVFGLLWCGWNIKFAPASREVAQGY